MVEGEDGLVVDANDQAGILERIARLRAKSFALPAIDISVLAHPIALTLVASADLGPPTPLAQPA